MLDQDALERTLTKEINGKSYTIKATDPYGAWVITAEYGDPPKELRGNYTNSERAWSAIEAYERAKDMKEATARKIHSTDGKGGKPKKVPLNTLIEA